jgi:murein DD-endopeptidase MepM/ murein hydrolase activator NlpD
MAAKSGRVISAQSNPGMGKYVIIMHAGELVTLYGHLDSICVKQGQRLRQGQLIGRVGKSGNAGHKAILPHLHFEVRKKGAYCDPMQFL